MKNLKWRSRKVARDQRDIVGATSPGGTPTWTVTNANTDRSIDANGIVGVIGDGLATLIEDLIAQGVLKGSVTQE